MNYDILIATRNRSSALAMSLPLFARQTRQPSNIIIVDASDDRTAAHEVARRSLDGTSISFKVITSVTRSSAHQRNRGLLEVTSPITMIPDDDSLWFEDTASELMKVYEADHLGKVGGVTARGVKSSPLEATQLVYRPSLKAQIRDIFQPLRSKVENTVMKQPFIAYAEEVTRDLECPAWVDNHQSRRVHTIGGFRMSFRSNVIKETLFDETLGYKSGYCQHEDMDASLRVQKNGLLLLSAEKARVFHHLFPGNRSDGFSYGFGQIANYMYICCKVMPGDSSAWESFEKYLTYKIWIYRLRRGRYWNDVFRGATFAWTNRQILLQSPVGSIQDAFKALCDRTHGVSL